MTVNLPERLINELVRQQKRHLTVIANDTALPGKGIGKLISAHVVDRFIANRSPSRVFPVRLRVFNKRVLYGGVSDD